jgi:uncharacterized repeat protein (TIGR03803 family)
MQAKRSSTALIATLAMFTVTLLATSTRAVAQKEKVLYSFNGADGAYPTAGLIPDAAGNLYGTTLYGGTDDKGVVFELTPKVGGGWTQTVLHSFGNRGDGTGPYARLILDATGNLYGATAEGGVYRSGVVFELAPKKGGGWTEKLLHSFGQGKDGSSPRASLIVDAAGDLYGTTPVGGADGLGTVFELTPKAGGKWTEKVLHGFNSKDGENPDASLILDAAGNLYGPTQDSIFELMPKTGGGWTEKVLYHSGSTASLIFDGAGRLYGTTAQGGLYGYGTVFKLTGKANGKWTYLTLYSFPGDEDGAYPYAGLILGASGHLYGTTYQGGADGQGTVFEFTP